MEQVIYYTVPEVATLLKFKKNYIYDLIGQGRLKAIRVSERRTRIPSDALAEFLKGANADILSYNIITRSPLRGRRPNGTDKE